MRILHVFDHSLPLQSGYVFRSLGILTAQRALGWDTVHVTAPRQQVGDGSETVDGWTFHRTPKPTGLLAGLPGFSYWAEMQATAARLKVVARQTGADILHAHSPALNGLPAIWAGRALGLPVVYEVRGFWEDAAVDHGTTTEGSLRYRLGRALETHVLQRADAVTVLCQGVYDELIRRGISADRMTIIPNAVNPDLFSTSRSADTALRTKLGLDGVTVLGFIGSFYDYEGLEIALTALRQVRETDPSVRLLLVGGGPQDEALRALAIKLELGDAVVFTGRVPFDAVGQYYDLVDCFLYPRKRMRLTDMVTPLKPLEAMASGQIVAGSDVGGLRELITDGDNGFLFAADDPDALAAAIRRIIAARADWPAMAARARHYVETERSWTASVARYRPVYDRLLTRRAGSGASR